MPQKLAPSQCVKDAGARSFKANDQHSGAVAALLRGIGYSVYVRL
jgi:hypothetical protein